MSKLRELLPANRVALYLGLLGAVAAFIASVQTSFIPGSPPAEALSKAAGAVASIVMALKLIDRFLDGAQNWDSIQATGAPKVPGVTVVNNAAIGDTIDVDTPDYIGPEDAAPVPNAPEEHPMYEQELGGTASERLAGFDRPTPEDEKE